ncbi:MAG: hypothetical protein ABIJ57_00210 [Pseudomonadota bacterium]
MTEIERPFYFICGKCDSAGIYRDGDGSLACLMCGNRYYEAVGGKTKGIAPKKVYKGEAVSNFLKPEKKEKVETLLREGSGIREISRLTGISTNTVANIAKAIPGSEEMKCKCGLLLNHKGRCEARREATKAAREKVAAVPLASLVSKTDQWLTELNEKRGREIQAQEIPLTIRLTIDVTVVVNGVAV